MARGRHARRSRWLAWLSPTPAPEPRWRDVHAQTLVRLCDDVTALQGELTLLRAASERSTAVALAAELRAQGLAEQLAADRAEAAALRRDLDALREELVWASAERRLPVDGTPVPRLRPARRSS